MNEVDHQFSHRSLPQSPARLFSAAAVRELDRRTIEEYGIPGYALMQRAAAAAWRALLERWPQPRRVHVVCGPGNNGGDGYEIARLALAHSLEASVSEPLQHQAKGDALLARQAWLADGGTVKTAVPGDMQAGDVIVDALFGIGLVGAPTNANSVAIAAINSAHTLGCGVLAVDIPSGLQADTGVAPGAAVQADLTVTFIGRKLGLYTGQGPDFCGAIAFDALAVPEQVYAGTDSMAGLQDRVDLRGWLPRRARTAHKGSHGHVLVVGGDLGTAGAALLCARSALRAGAGLVSLATRAANAASLTAAQPELMCRGVESSDELRQMLERADVVAIGPGLGQDDWGKTMYRLVQASEKPQVVDADALNLLARAPYRNARRIITPHPGEAGRLLDCSTSAVQNDRVAAAIALHERFDGVAVLKGAGTLVRGGAMNLCPYGNPGMGVGGMGDVLTGIIAACLAQGLPLEVAANAGVLAHALAGDHAAAAGERGLLPSDLIAHLRAVVNA